MATPPTILNAQDFCEAAREVLQFRAVRYSSGPSKTHLKGGNEVFLDGLMTNAHKKADVGIVTDALNAAALYGWAVYENATKINQLLTMIFKRVTGESDAVCELAASLSAIALEWPEFDEIRTRLYILTLLAGGYTNLYTIMYKQLEAARQL